MGGAVGGAVGVATIVYGVDVALGRSVGGGAVEIGDAVGNGVGSGTSVGAGVTTDWFAAAGEAVKVGGAAVAVAGATPVEVAASVGVNRRTVAVGSAAPTSDWRNTLRKSMAKAIRPKLKTTPSSAVTPSGGRQESRRTGLGWAGVQGFGRGGSFGFSAVNEGRDRRLSSSSCVPVEGKGAVVDVVTTLRSKRNR